MLHFLLLAIAQASSINIQDQSCGNVIKEMKYIDRGFCLTTFTFRKTETICLDGDVLLEAFGNLAIIYFVFCLVFSTSKAIYSHFVH